MKVCFLIDKDLACLIEIVCQIKPFIDSIFRINFLKPLPLKIVLISFL